MARMLFLFFLLILFFSQSLISQECTIINKGAFYGSPVTNERGYCLEASPGGNSYYVTGLKTDSVLIFEVDLAGEVLWSREIDIIPNLPDHVSSMIVDSEGMLAFVGVSGSIISGGRIFAFRYNPLSNQILWAKEYDVQLSRDFPHSILQRGPGGNYIVSTNPHDDMESKNDCQVF